MRRFLGSFLGGCLAIAGLSASHAASLQFILTDCNDGATCATQFGNNFGTVTITDVGVDQVSVNVDLAAGYTWANTGLIGFGFNLPGVPAVPTLSNVTASNWTPTSGNPLVIADLGGNPSDGMGTAQYGLDFTGANNSVSADLNFTLTAAGLDVSDFTTGGVSGDTGKQYYFIADICTRTTSCSGGTTNFTGLVGAVPVPGPIVGAGLPGLLLAGAGLIALARRRRKYA